MQAGTAIAGETLPLVLLPGTLCDARVFAPLIARLGERTCIVADLHRLTSAAALAERLLAEAPPRFALLGFSLGAMVALEVAARAPHRVAGLALVAGNAHAVPEDQRTARRRVAAEVESVDRHVGETLWHASVADPANEEMRQLVMAMALAAPRGALPAQVEVAVSRADSLPRLATLAMPTLVLAGAEDAINPLAFQQTLASGLPDARLVLVPQAGHFALLEQPDACADAVREWLARIDGATIANATIAAESPSGDPADPCFKEIV